MDKQMLQQIRIDMNAALEAVAKKHGLNKLAAGNCSYDPAGAFTFKVEGVIGGGLSKDEARYENERSAYGLPPLGAHWTDQSGTNVIEGMTAGGKVIFSRGGKKFVADADAVKVRVAKYG
jgi:hypothetical protein